MKSTTSRDQDLKNDEMLPEYDFTGGVRGKHHKAYREDHSVEELREIIVGHSSQNRLLVVSFTERDDVIRITSARKADREEREDYENAKR